MATVQTTTMVDDLDGGVAETTVYFALDNQAYKIDLSKANELELRDALAPYVRVATKTSIDEAATARRKSSATTRPYDPKDVRAWAKENGWPQTPKAGRFPKDLINAYLAAQLAPAQSSGNGQGQLAESAVA